MQDGNLSASRLPTIVGMIEMRAALFHRQQKGDMHLPLWEMNLGEKGALESLLKTKFL